MSEVNELSLTDSQVKNMAPLMKDVGLIKYSIWELNCDTYLIKVDRTASSEMTITLTENEATLYFTSDTTNRMISEIIDIENKKQEEKIKFVINNILSKYS